jgi:hypothetical protein
MRCWLMGLVGRVRETRQGSGEGLSKGSKAAAGSGSSGAWLLRAIHLMQKIHDYPSK